jgi:hypothetical protein
LRAPAPLAQLSIEPPEPHADGRCKDRHDAAQHNKGDESEYDGNRNDQRTDEYDENIGNRITRRQTTIAE